MIMTITPRLKQHSRLLLASLLVAAGLVAGCAAPQISDYAAQTPVLDMRQYFNGTIDAYGVFTNRSGKVLKRFTVLMTCSWQGDTGTLDEDFTKDVESGIASRSQPWTPPAWE